MIRLTATVALTFLLCIGVAPLPAIAGGVSLNWGSEVNPSQCPTDQGYRYLEINVTRKVEGDPTQGVMGNTWADREYNQHIQVWRIGASEGGGGAERFCALVRYQGSFTTTTPAGPSPQGTDSSIAPNIDGSFEGGYRLVFNADEIASPAYRDRGDIGTFRGPIGLTDWQSYYFANVGANDIQWWGWIYHGGNNGAWVNSIAANQGDITD